MDVYETISGLKHYFVSQPDSLPPYVLLREQHIQDIACRDQTQIPLVLPPTTKNTANISYMQPSPKCLKRLPRYFQSHMASVVDEDEF